MAANTSPIYSLAPDVQGGPLIATAATVVYDISGTIGTDIYKLFTADATNGGFVQRVRFKYAANAATPSIAALIRLWVSSVGSGTPTLGTQAWFYDEIALPAQTPSTTVSQAGYDVPFNFALPLSYTILAKISVSQSANSGWLGLVVGGKY